MSESKVLTFIFESAWAITQPALETIIKIASRENLDFDLDKLPERKAVFDTNSQILSGTNNVWLNGSVAVIPVIGSIFPRANLFSRISGAASVDLITADFKTALADDSVSSILLYADSPGGQVTGVQELADLIYASREIKPIKGYVYGQGNSAMYYLLSATEEIIASESSVVGSVGVLAAIQDTREKDRKAGTKTIEFVSSVSPNKTIDFENEASLQKVQRMVDALGTVMVEKIAMYRGVTSETVLSKYGQGDVFVGGIALEQGMIDSVGSFDSVVTEMNSTQNLQLRRGGGLMDYNTLKSQHTALFDEVKAEGAKEASDGIDAKLAKAREEGATAERERIQEIESINVPGASETISKLKFDSSQTKATVAIAILEKQQKTFTDKANAVSSDAKDLGSQSAQVVKDSDVSTQIDQKASEKEIDDAMAKGINN